MLAEEFQQTKPLEHSELSLRLFFGLHFQLEGSPILLQHTREQHHHLMMANIL